MAMKRFSLPLLIVLFAFCLCSPAGFGQQIPPVKTGEIQGTVYRLGSGQRLVGASVRLIETNQFRTTDAKGEFRFINLPPGEYTLNASAWGYRVLEAQAVIIKPNDITAVKIYLGRIEFLFEEVLVTTQRLPVTVSQTSLRSLEIKRIPGTGGDALRALSSLPGIGVANDFSGQLYIRGGGPDDNVFYFDRVPLGAVYHFGALVSTISSEIIDRIDVYPGGFGAEFGADAQAVIDIYSRNRSQDEWRGKFNVNLLYSEGLLEGNIGQRGFWYLAGRRSYIDLFPLEFEQIRQFPRFWDYQLKLSYDLSEKHQLNLSAFAADDIFKLNIDADIADDDATLIGDFSFADRFNTQAIQLRSLLTDRLTSNLSLSRSTRFFGINFGQGFFLNIEPTDYQLREDLKYELTPKMQLESGLILSSGPRKASTFFVRPPDEGDPSFNFTFEEKVRVESEERFDFIEGYLQSRYSLFPFLSFAAGLRLEYFNLTDRISLAPRGSLNFTIPTGARVRLAIGRYEQSPQPYQILPEVGNPALTDSSANHYMLEIERQISTSTGVKLAGFQKELSDLVTRDEAATYLNQGKGYAHGIEFSVNHRVGEKFFAWANYAYSRSKRRDRPEDPERRYSFDQPHVATLIASYKFTPTWEMGAKWQYASGNPYTPVIGTTQEPNPTTGEMTYRPIFGETNSLRYPPVHRLDLRLKKSFISNRWQMGVYLEIFNVYNRKNVLEFDYNEDYTELEETNTQLPLLPYLGLTAEF